MMSIAGKFVQMVAFGGFVTMATLFISLNQKAFKNVFGKNAKKYWWLMLAFLIIPFLLIVLLFSFIFAPKSNAGPTYQKQPEIHRNI